MKPRSFLDIHLKLHATQQKQLTQTQTHSLHDLNAYLDPPRNIKATIVHNNKHTNIIISKPDITPEEYRENLKNIYTINTSQYLSSRKSNKVSNTIPYGIHSSEKTLPHHLHTKLAQLKANKSPLLQSYLLIHTVNPKTYMQQCPLCLSHTHMTLISSLTVMKCQHNTTPLVCEKSL